MWLWTHSMHTQKLIHSYALIQYDRESRKQKYAIQTTNASIIHAATDWHTVCIQYTHTKHIQVYSKKVFYLVEPVQVWIKLHFGRIAVYECSNRHCQYAPLFNGERISSFQWLLHLLMCAHTHTHTHIHFVIWMVNHRCQCKYVCVFECWCVVYGGVPVCCIFVCICVCVCVVVICFFFSLLFTSLFFVVFISHRTFEIRVYLSVHIRYFQCVRLIRFLVLVVQLN